MILDKLHLSRVKRLIFQIIFLFLTLVISVGFSTSSEQEANKLFRKALEIVKSAQETEKTSYSEAFRLYDEAIKKIEKIIKDYPLSKLVIALTQDRVKIGPYTLTEFKETIIPQVKMKAEAEEDPFICSVLLVKSLEDDDYFWEGSIPSRAADIALIKSCISKEHFNAQISADTIETLNPKL